MRKVIVDNIVRACAIFGGLALAFKIVGLASNLSWWIISIPYIVIILLFLFEMLMISLEDKI